MYKKILLFAVCLFSLSLVSAMQSGLNYYDTFENYLTIPTPDKTYALDFVMDDIGTIPNDVLIMDIDNDSITEMVIPEYSGRLRIWTWDGMKNGTREYLDSDRGTYYLGTALSDKISGRSIGEECIDNDGDGYCELAINDYNGYLRVVEYDGSSMSVYNEPSDRGNYRTSPTWCDIDADGDFDIFTCTYAGVCRLYLYNAGTFSLSFTDSDRGTYHYGNHPECADVNNDGFVDLVVNRYEGYFQTYNWSAGALTYQGQMGDYGSFWGQPYVGDFLGNGMNYTIVCDSAGYCRGLNCTPGLDSCVLMDVSNDIGSFAYGGSEFEKVVGSDKFGDKDVLLGAEAYGKLVLVQLVTSTLITINEHGLDMDDETYTGVEITESDGEYYLLRTTRYSGDVAVDKSSDIMKWATVSFYEDIVNRFYANNVHQGFLYFDGFKCGQLDTTTTSEECVAISYQGMPFIFTLQNISEYRTETYTDPELVFLDIMPRDALQYLPDGETRTYCVNDKVNVLENSLGGGNINAWANAYNGDGSAVSNGVRITDGVLSTAGRYSEQTSLDYALWTSGASGHFYFNMSKSVEMGQVTFWGYFHGQYDPVDLIVQISDTNCDSPNFVTIFNETDSDISGSATREGIVMRFVPQDVSCIRVEAGGYIQNQGTYAVHNVATELAGYRANNCTFYTVPLDDAGAKLNNDYNVSMDIYGQKMRDSPTRYDSDYENPESTSSFILNVIDRIIIWLEQYT